MTEDLNDRLESWGDRPAPQVDGAFANRLESDLRASTLTRRGFDLGWLLRPGVVVAAAVVIVGAVFLVRRDNDASVQMVAADGTTVSIPGVSDTRQGAAGLELPEGSRIIVGPAGSAVVAGVVLEAGSTALITDGRVDVIDTGRAIGDVAADEPSDASPVTTAPDTTRPTTSVADSDDRPTPTSTSIVEDTRPGASTLPPDPNETDVPPPTTSDTVVPDSTPSTSEPGTTVPPTTKPPTDEPVDQPTIAPVPLSVNLEMGPVRDGQATLRWSVEGDTAEIAGWVVRIRRGDSSEVIATIRQPDVRRLRVAIPDGRVQFRVVARGTDAEVVASSRLIGPG